MDKNGINIINEIELETGPTVSNEFEFLNPMRRPVSENGTGGTDDNVLSNINYLFEFDKIPIDEQRLLIKKNRDYINRVVFSGGKSYHCIVTINEDTTEYEDVKERYKWIHKFLNDNLFDGLGDPTCGNQGRRTRKPGVIRKDTGLEQKLIFQKNIRIEFDYQTYYDEWKNKKVINEKAARLAGLNKRFRNCEVDLETLSKRNINQNARDLINGNLVEDGTRHSKIWSAVFSLKGLDRDKNEVYELVKQTGIKDWKTIVDWVYRK